MINKCYNNHSGIYCISNILNGHKYIGQAKNLSARYNDHRYNFNSCGPEYNKQLYQAFRKYGLENFTFEILEEFENYNRELLNELEEKYIAQYNSFKDGYNATDIASGGFVSQEHKNNCTQVLQQLNERQKGCNHPRAFFSEEQIKEIFHYAMLGAPAKEIYKMYSHLGIKRYSFYNIYNGKHYKELLPEQWEKRPKVHTNAKIWGCEVVKIKQAQKNGNSLTQICAMFPQYPPLIIRDIYNGRTYKNIIC